MTKTLAVVLSLASILFTSGIVDASDDADPVTQNRDALRAVLQPATDLYDRDSEVARTTRPELYLQTLEWAAGAIAEYDSRGVQLDWFDHTLQRYQHARSDITDGLIALRAQLGSGDTAAAVLTMQNLQVKFLTYDRNGYKPWPIDELLLSAVPYSASEKRAANGKSLALLAALTAIIGGGAFALLRS